MSNEPRDQDPSTVVPFPAPAGKSPVRREKLFNLPPATKYFLALLLAIQAVMECLSEDRQDWVVMHFGFVPGAYTGHAPFTWMALLAPLTYMLLHGGWAHVLINGAMLMAFGAGVERWLGARKMLIFFALCGIASAFVQFLLDPASTMPVIGASGGLSGLFAAVLILMQRGGIGAGGRFGLWPLVILWVVVSALVGFAGAPDGSAVAWAAHIGGFGAGFLLLKPIEKLG